MTIDAHPELPVFDLIQPVSLTEASRFLAEHAGEARPLLGGTDIFVRLRDGLWHDKYLVDIKKLEGLAQLRFEPSGNGNQGGGLTIGAAVNMNRASTSPEALRYYPLLVEACRSVASYQLRTRATIVGNICNASPAGDTIGACMVLGGVLKVHGVDGWRDVPLVDGTHSTFFLGPGKNALKPGDIVTSIFLPIPPSGSQGAYIKLGRNTLSDLSIVGVAVLGYPLPGDQPGSPPTSGYRFRIALASVAPVPLIPETAQEYLETHSPGAKTFKEAARLAAEACSPIDDVRASARYRKAMVGKLTEQALEITWNRLNTGEVNPR
jgi:CO/xanthine dehydrogenase FAD-binding subunit